MAKRTLSVPDELVERIEQYNEAGIQVNWSKLFQDALERFFEIEERARDTNIPLYIIQKVIEELEFESEKLSLDFGKDLFFEWIIKKGNAKHIFSISQIPETYLDLYNKFGDIIEPIEEYEKYFKDKYGANIFDRDVFAKGFISTAKTLVKKLEK